MNNKLKKFIVAVIAVLTLVVGSISLTGCNYCAHQLKTIEGEASTCTVHGHMTSYECKKCGKLFAYSATEGLYEIKEAAERPLAEHTPAIPVFEDDATAEEIALATKNLFTFKLKEGVSTAASPEDYEVYAACADCGEEGLVPEDKLFPSVVPDGMIKGKHITVGESTIATSFKLDAGWGGADVDANGVVNSGEKRVLDLIWDSDANLSSWFVPVTVGVRRYSIVFAYNSGSQPIDIVYRAIYMKNKSKEKFYDTEATLAPGWNAFTAGVTHNVSIPVWQTDIFVKEELQEDVELRFSSFYYVDDTKPKGLSVYSKPRTTYNVGDTFDGSGMQLRVSYGNNVFKVIDGSECKTSLDGRELTDKDVRVMVKYKGLSVAVGLNVGKEVEKKKVTLVGATFADGSKSKELEIGTHFLTDVKLQENKTFKRFVGKHGETLSKFTPVDDYAMTVKAEYEEDTDGEIITVDDCEEYAANLLDGRYMDKSGAGSHDIVFKFKENHTLDKLIIYPWVGSVKNLPRRTYSSIKSFTLSVSDDGENWREIYVCEYDPCCEDESVYDYNDDGAGGNPVLLKAYFDAVTTKYFRITEDVRNIYGTGGSCGMSEVEIFCLD